jgi:biopolymer transport protein ExbD/biopolymer transport protein TolR
MSMDFGGKGVKSDINVTPLVDVVLVLLIIFMVITPLLQRGKAVQLPRAKVVSDLKHGGDPILLSVTPDGRTWLDKVEVPRKDLAETLTGEMVARPGAPLVVKADKTLAYKVVREVILEISKTRVVGVSLAATQMRPGEIP